jgi:hypothetical protein
LLFTKEVIDEIDKEADAVGLDTAGLLAIAEVESGGVAEWTVDGHSVPPIRFEGHYFYARLSGDKRAAAVAQGLASPAAGAITNPSSYKGRYDLLDRAVKIDRAAAYESTSWGLGQVMGANWHSLGYESVDEFVKEAQSGVAGQVELMIRFIMQNHLDDEIDRKDWDGFAKVYNGPRYAVNNYAGKMKAAYAKWYGTLTPDPITGIKKWQSDLIKLGYKVGVADGKVGPKTIAAVKAFQTASGLVVDGKVGKMTLDAIAKAVAAVGVSKGHALMSTGQILTSITAVAGAVGTLAATAPADDAFVAVLNKQIDVLRPIFHALPYGDYVITAMVVGSVALTVYGAFKKLRAAAKA